MTPLPSFTLTGNLNDILPTPVAGELAEAAWTSAYVLLVSNIKTGVLTWGGKVYDRPPSVKALVGSDGSITVGGQPIKLLANDPGLNVEGIQWRCDIKSGPNKVLASFWFDAPADGASIALAAVTPVQAVSLNEFTRGRDGFPFGGLQAVPGEPAQKQPLVATDEGLEPAGGPVDFAEAIHDGIVDELQNDDTVIEAAEAAVDVAVQGKIGSGLHYKGRWNASTNTPALADGTGTAGDQWIVTTAGTRNLGSGSQVFAVGDAAVYNGTVWQQIDKAALAATGQFVQIGSNANYPRSSSAVIEVFAATVEPLNAIDGDMWADYSGTAPNITTTVLSSLSVGIPTVQNLAVTGTLPVSGSMTWTKVAGTIPAGLTLSTAGQLSGTPTTTGAYDFTVQAENGYGTDTQQYTGTVGAAVAPTIGTTALGGTLQAGVDYLQIIAVTGSTPIAWSVVSGTLPSGLTLNASTGTISGAPTTAGAYDFTVRATNSAGYADKQYTGTILGSAPVITTTSLNPISQGAAFSQTPAVTGTSPITWAVQAGTIPTGLSLNTSTGQIYGTPSGSGAYDFTIRATNAYGYDDQQYTGTVASATPAVTTSAMNAIYRAVAFTQTLTVTGGTPITFAVQSGSLPTGLSLNTSTGVISGTPSAAGSYSFTIRATNSYGTNDKAFTGSVLESTPAITETSLDTIRVTVAFSQVLHATGYPTITFAVQAGTLPAGLSLNSSTGVISGTPTTAGAYDFTIRATNSVGYGDRQFTGTVANSNVAFDAIGAGGSQNTASNTKTVSHTAAAGSYAVVEVTHLPYYSGAISSVTYGGTVANPTTATNMTYLGGYTNGTGTSAVTTSYYGLANVAGGAKNVVVTTASSGYMSIGTISASSVGSASAVQTVSGYGTALSQTVSGITTGQLVIQSFGARGGPVGDGIGTFAGGTYRWDGWSIPALGQRAAASSISTSTAASTTFTAAAASINSMYWVGVAIVLSP